MTSMPRHWRYPGHPRSAVYALARIERALDERKVLSDLAIADLLHRSLSTARHYMLKMSTRPGVSRVGRTLRRTDD